MYFHLHEEGNKVELAMNHSEEFTIMEIIRYGRPGGLCSIVFSRPFVLASQFHTCLA